MKKAKTVDEYIDNTAPKYNKILNELRLLIKKIVPDARESISYGMPFYDFKGRLVYFSAQREYIGLYIPPPIIENHSKELIGYVTTKSAIHLPLKKLPSSLIKKLIKARMKFNEEKL